MSSRENNLLKSKLSQGKATLEDILNVLEEIQKDTSQQLIRVRRRINVLEKKVLPIGFEGDDLESDKMWMKTMHQLMHMGLNR